MYLVPKPDRLERAIRNAPFLPFVTAAVVLVLLFERGHWLLGAILVVNLLVSIAGEFSPEIARAYLALRSALRLKAQP